MTGLPSIVACLLAGFHLLLGSLLTGPAHAFQSTINGNGRLPRLAASQLLVYSASDGADIIDIDTRSPQVFATGYSNNPDLHTAIQQATQSALSALPPLDPSQPLDSVGIDLAIVTMSSLFQGSPATVVPALTSVASVYGRGVDKLIGCTSSGIISSVVKLDDDPSSAAGVGVATGTGGAAGDGGLNGNDNAAAAETAVRECVPIETEGLPGISVTLALLPDVDVSTFHVLSEDVPDDAGRVTAKEWNNCVGLRGFAEKKEGQSDDPVFLLIPSPAFQSDLDGLVDGISVHHPSSTIIGGVASTVSSLSRAQLFLYDSKDSNVQCTLGDGCVGVVLEGDIEVQTLLAQGAKPVGGIYRVVSGEDSTIGSIMLDEEATKENDEAAEILGEDKEDEEMDANAKAKAAYAKAAIPKPVLAEANYLMKTLSDDDQAFMRKTILVGLERGGSIGRTPNDLIRLAKGEGHRFAVHQVASAGMKDGSVTLPLGSVNVEKNCRFRFFVRDGDFAKKEIDALFTGYKKTSLANMFEGKNIPSPPTCCMVFSTIDRGSNLFGGKPGLEAGKVSEFFPTVAAITGLKANGVLGQLDPQTSSGKLDTMVHGSAASYVIFRSKTNRPAYSPRQAASKVIEESDESTAAEKNEQISQRASRNLAALNEAAPRDEDGELVLRRREVHSGRAISVSTVSWSVADKMAKPTSALEGFMWDKETEVDRFRERVPLSNLVSQCKLFNLDPSKPKPRAFMESLMKHKDDTFIILPECKRMEPSTGSLRKRYDVRKIVTELTTSGAPAVSINCDPILFGGCLEDITVARDAAISASADVDSAPPILASDLILYPYQLYKLRLAGADAARLVAGALESKDLLYLTKIAGSLNMETLISVCSEKQIKEITPLTPGSIKAVIVSNRELEDFSFDESGEQALSLLRSDALKDFLTVHDVPVFVEGRVGIIEWEGEDGKISASNYVKELNVAGASGAFIGGGLADRSKDASVKAAWNALLDDANVTSI